MTDEASDREQTRSEQVAEGQPNAVRSGDARPRIGLALAGGGPAGAVYEIGALRALDVAIEGLDLTACESYVGVSAGSFVAACLANGISTRQLVRMLFRNEPGEIPFAPDTFFSPALGEWVRRGIAVPGLVVDSVWRWVTGAGERTLTAALTHVAQALPVGLFDNEPIRRYVHALLTANRRTDDFRALGARLTIVAADLEAGEAVRFGEPPWDHVPISTAIQASTAVPGLYLPVRVRATDGEERLCVDGALHKTVHASVPLERGVGLLLCVNPIVPVDMRPATARGAARRGTLVARGLPTVLSQTARTVLHSRMQAGVAQYAQRFPNADVILFEPQRQELGMFFADIFSFRAREAICELAWSVTLEDLRRRRETLAPALARHGLRLRDEVLDAPPASLWEGVGLRPSRHGRPAGERLAPDFAVRPAVGAA